MNVSVSGAHRERKEEAGAPQPPSLRASPGLTEAQAFWFANSEPPVIHGLCSMDGLPNVCLAWSNTWLGILKDLGARLEEREPAKVLPHG